MKVDPNAPLFIRGMLKLDDDRTIWLQCKYERIFKIYFACGRTGHKVKNCNGSRQLIATTIWHQMDRIRDIYEVRIGVDFIEFHFVGKAKAFASYPSWNTPRVYLIYKNIEF